MSESAANWSLANFFAFGLNLLALGWNLGGGPSRLNEFGQGVSLCVSVFFALAVLVTTFGLSREVRKAE